MTESNFSGKTRWESDQYRRDHGRRARVAAAHRALADFIEADEHTPVPPMNETALALAPTAEAVNEWAARHHASASWRHGTYRASVSFGEELSYVLVYVPPDAADAPASRELEKAVA